MNKADKKIVSGSNKNIYVKNADLKYWERAQKLIPFYLGMSVSEFCSAAIKDAVIELENKQS